LFRRVSILATLVTLLGIGAIPASSAPLLVPNADDGGSGSATSGPSLTVSRLFDEVFTQKKGEVCAELMTAGALHQTPAGQYTGPDGFNAYAATIWAAFPDAVFVVDEVSENGTSVAVRWSMAGTHTGPLEDLAASGKPVTLHGLALFHFHGDRIASTWFQYDRLGLIEQVTSAPRATCPRCEETP
jgi:predicted ester cyclase